MPRKWFPPLALAFLLPALISPAPAEDKHPPLNSMPAPKRALVPRLKGSIKIDGEITDSGWSKAAVLEPFFKNDGSGPEREHTSVRITYDSKDEQ